MLKARILDNERVAAENPPNAAVFLSPGDDSWLAQYTKGQISIVPHTSLDIPPHDDISELYVHLSSMSSTLDEPTPTMITTTLPNAISEPPTPSPAPLPLPVPPTVLVLRALLFPLLSYHFCYP
jgi:hypothetical protein